MVPVMKRVQWSSFVYIYNINRRKATRANVQMVVEAFRGTGQSSELDSVDKVTEDSITQAPARFMAPAEAKEERQGAFYRTLLDAEEHGLLKEGDK